jgi:hypothetical protein
LQGHEPRARSAQRRRSQPAFIMIMTMKLVSVCAENAEQYAKYVISRMHNYCSRNLQNM